MARRIIALVVAVLSVVSAADAQPSPAEASLAAGISQVRDGDSLRALFSLNDAVSKLLGRPDASATLARAHAYRALVYVGLDQPERAQTAALLALRADPNIAIAGPEFTPGVVALFDAARRPANGNPEAAAQTAEQAGRFQEAFLGYLSAYRSLPEPPPAADDQRLREKIMKVVQKLSTNPAIPPEAREHFSKAQALLDAEAVLGNTSGAAATQAATEFSQAIRIAPWWAEATLQLATVLQKLQRLDAALANLKVYRLAEPPVSAATVVTTALESKPSAPVVIAPAAIYIYYARTGGPLGKRWKVLCDGYHVADLGRGRFVLLHTQPGMHSISFEGKVVSARFDAGQEYYLRALSIRKGLMAGLEFQVAPSEEATAEMRKVAKTANDPRKTYNSECGALAPRGAR